jgi:hypothetical protein
MDSEHYYTPPCVAGSEAAPVYEGAIAALYSAY